LSNIFVLDACALIATLKNEKGADIVADAYKKANKGEAMLLMNRVNLFEVYYGFYRDDGKDYAENILKNLKQSMLSICEFNDTTFVEAGRLKATYKISLADSIVLAQAIISNGTLLTADHHEFDVIEKHENISFRWIR